MDYCGSGGSGRRRVLMDKFQQFLENIDERSDNFHNLKTDITLFLSFMSNCVDF